MRVIERPERVAARKDLAPPRRKLTSTALDAAPGVIGLVVGTVVGFFGLIRPLFGFYLPQSASADFTNHVALVAGALDTWRNTHAPPISSNALVSGIEYPYYLIGNNGFYIVASFVSFILNAPATLGTAITLVAGLVVGQLGTYVLARSFGLNRWYAIVLGFLYASGPYMSLNLLVRFDLPEFLAWEIVPLLCFLARRAMQPRAGILSLATLCVALALPMYIHKLVGPHILLFVGALMLAQIRLSPGWFLRVFAVGVSVPCIAVFAWLPVFGLDRDQVLTFRVGSMGAITVLNDSIANYLSPWEQNSLANALREPAYGERFGLQLGLLATLGLAYGAWQLCATRFRPRHKELYIALVAGVIYSALVLGVGDIVHKLPFPLNTIQFSYRLLGLASISGLVALIAALSERVPRANDGRGYLVAGAAALLIAASNATHWQPPTASQVPQASLVPSMLVDLNSFYSKTFKGMFDTSGGVAPDGTLGARPWPIGLGGAVEHVLPGGSEPLPRESRTLPLQTLFLFAHRRVTPASDEAGVTIRIYGLRAVSTPPCAAESELPKEQPDVFTALVNLCHSRSPDIKEPVVGVVGSMTPKLLETRALTGLDHIAVRFAVPAGTNFIALECTTPNCVTVDYFGPANQLDGSVRVPQSLPSDSISRGPFGQYTVDASHLPAGDYVLPTFDYAFVNVTDENGNFASLYQFDTRPVIRVDDDVPHTYTVWYDLRLELMVLYAWGACAAVVLACRWVFRGWTSPAQLPRPADSDLE